MEISQKHLTDLLFVQHRGQSSQDLLISLPSLSDYKINEVAYCLSVHFFNAKFVHIRHVIIVCTKHRILLILEFVLEVLSFCLLQNLHL